LHFSGLKVSQKNKIKHGCQSAKKAAEKGLNHVPLPAHML